VPGSKKSRGVLGGLYGVWNTIPLWAAGQDPWLFVLLVIAGLYILKALSLRHLPSTAEAYALGLRVTLGHPTHIFCCHSLLVPIGLDLLLTII
jgi:hypothetical protein